MLDVTKIRQDFPIFDKHPNLIYLDSTATSLKPRSVIEKLTEYYSEYSSNIHRGLYPIAQRADTEYHATREIVAKFIHAKSTQEIIFTRNTSESLNLLMYTLGEKIIEPGDEIVTTIAEHHSNFVPWQVLCENKQATFKVVKIDKQATVDLVELAEKITPKTKILAITYLSNVLGTVNPIEQVVEIARRINPEIIIIVDAAQAAPHIPINVETLKVDFLAFSSHKMLGPTGVGVLWGRKELLEQIGPFMYGGDMIDEVTVEKTTFAKLPYKFEAGTPSIGEVIAFKEAIKYLEQIGLENIEQHEKMLINLAFTKLKDKFGENIQFIGPSDPTNKTGILAFVFKDYHPHDVADILGQKEICIRAGHHCAAPLHQAANIPASSRMSFYLYTTPEDIDKIVDGLESVDKILKMGFHERSINSKFKQPCC